MPARWIACLALLLPLLAAAEPLVTINQALVASLEQRSVSTTLVDAAGQPAVEVASRHDQDWPGLTIKPPQGKWDLTKSTTVVVDLANVGTSPVEISVRVDNPGADGATKCLVNRTTLPPGQSGAVKVEIARATVIPGLKLFGMRGYPALGEPTGRTIDPANVVAVLVFVPKPKEDHKFRILGLRTEGTFVPGAPPLTAEQFFPFIDTFGQYRHRDWPGKIKSLEDLRSRVEVERRDLDAHPGPAEWDEYGGWAAGPTQRATGFFRAEKVDGQWWLIDPLGKLFWSHGVDCVRVDNATPIDERATWFEDFPGNQPDLQQFLGRGRSIKGHYAGRTPATYDFSGANLQRKYGSTEWRQKFADISHQRLRSWGTNTIANWSDSAIYLLRRTPYTATVSASGPPIAGSQGYWGQFADPFHTDFKANLARTMQGQVGKAAGDPWCLGFFVDNELGWGDEMSLALAALASPATQPAKVEFVQDLRAKYDTIAKLNEAWGTTHASWDALLQAQTPPNKAKAGDDLKAFYTRIAEAYFGTIRDAVKAVAPQQIYFGCRFAWANDRAIRAAAKFCDVVSFNLYRREVASFKLPAGVDLPIIIGEFHFGALDRGMFHTGLQKTGSQDERAAAYRSYVEGALRHPQFVGSHWFKYTDQAPTGRTLDEENYQIGFVDLCDTPYPETIAAVREVGYRMYQIRREAK